MVTQLPPLGPRGWSPEDVVGLPALPAGFAWGRPYYGGSLVIAGEVAVLVGSDQVAMVSPLVTGAGWLAQVGKHREALPGQDRLVDLGLLRRLGPVELGPDRWGSFGIHSSPNCSQHSLTYSSRVRCAPNSFT